MAALLGRVITTIFIVHCGVKSCLPKVVLHPQTKAESTWLLQVGGYRKAHVMWKSKTKHCIFSFAGPVQKLGLCWKLEHKPSWMSSSRDFPKCWVTYFRVVYLGMCKLLCVAEIKCLPFSYSCCIQIQPRHSHKSGTVSQRAQIYSISDKPDA